MDKNFINVDELVRQRMSGREEQSRAGAWQNMRELLDKEMPQQPTPLFPWRKILGSMSVLVVACAVGLGGYKMATGVKNNEQPRNNEPVTITTASVASPAGNTTNVEASSVNSGPNAVMPAGNTVTGANKVTMMNTPDKNNRKNNSLTGVTKAAPAPSSMHTDEVATTAHRQVNIQLQPGTKLPSATGTDNAETGHAITDKTPLGNSDAAATNIADVSPDKALKNTGTANTQVIKNEVANNNNNTVARPVRTGIHADHETGVPVFVTKTGATIPGDKLQRINTDRARMNAAEGMSSDVNALRNKKVIQRMDIKERFIKTTPGEGFYKLDTISITTFTEEFGITTEIKTIKQNKK